MMDDHKLKMRLRKEKGSLSFLNRNEAIPMVVNQHKINQKLNLENFEPSPYQI